MWVWHKENRSDLGMCRLRVAPKWNETYEMLRRCVPRACWLLPASPASFIAEVPEMGVLASLREVKNGCPFRVISWKGYLKMAS